ncbi:antibiotic biosynthesis monooxygenase [Deinococcus detaillensis]|uniref:Antibiotic biosynthesis monooxygenase n=1 Tax=Deinococcus detaillensis TaxID=2592048 RepID=A0A553UZ18_9DEIO|nr:antibiotic biosynthesis monooxygenase [Deinococcus detaillensis]TSA85466.1 antibiotic biosynthesis monooxygenase [Deinococcus detaillensis]
MYVVMNRLPIPAGHAPAFEQMFTASFEHMKGVPGLQRITLQRPSKPDQPYVSTMEFENADAFRAWMGSPSFRASHAVPDGTPEGAMGRGSVIETFDTIADLNFTS